MARVKAPAPPREALDIEKSFRSLWAVVNNVDTPLRFVFGSIRTVLSRVGNATIEVAAAFTSFRRADKFFTRHGGDPISREWFLEATETLQKRIESLGQAGPSNVTREEITEALDELKKLTSSFKAVPLSAPRLPSTPPGRSSLFDELRELAKSSPRLKQAMLEFDDALQRGDPDTLQMATRNLHNAIGASDFKKTSRLRKQINDIVKHLDKTVPGARAEEALEQFYLRYLRLPANDRLRTVFEKFFRRAIDRNPELWMRIAERAMRSAKASNKDEVFGLVWRIKGALAELLARDLPQFRRLWSEQMQRARLLALERGPEWEVVAVRREVQSTTMAGTVGLFYDDGIFLVNRQTGEAIPTFAVQVKSGDWSSGTIIEQVKRDISRETIENAKIVIDGVEYRLAQSLERPTRAFVGTIAPVDLLPTPLLDDLNKLARTQPEIGNALQRLEDALIRFDTAGAQSAADDLSRAVPASMWDELQQTVMSLKAANGLIFVPIPARPSDIQWLSWFLLEALGKV